MTGCKISDLRLAEIIRQVYRDHQARGRPRPTEDQLFAAVGLRPGYRLGRMAQIARAMRRAGELPDLPRPDRRDQPPAEDRAAVAAAAAALEARRAAEAEAEARTEAPPAGGPAGPWAELVREHLERERRTRRWALAHEEVPCRCD